MLEVRAGREQRSRKRGSPLPPRCGSAQRRRCVSSLPISSGTGHTDLVGLKGVFAITGHKISNYNDQTAVPRLLLSHSLQPDPPLSSPSPSLPSSAPTRSSALDAGRRALPMFPITGDAYSSQVRHRVGPSQPFKGASRDGSAGTVEVGISHRWSRPVRIKTAPSSR